MAAQSELVIDLANACRPEANGPGFWNWPSHKHLIKAITVFVLFALWWAVLFFGANWITSLHSVRLRINLDLEQTIPYVPEAVVGYLSIHFLALMTLSSSAPTENFVL